MIMSGHQPNYLPWLGFFDKMRQSDIFVIEDNIQYGHRGYINRNVIKMQKGCQLLTVPVERGRERQLISEVKISNKGERDWAKRHWLSIKYNYCNAPFWSEYCDFFEETYSKEWVFLIDINMHLIKGIMAFLGINTPLVFASSLNAGGKKSDLVLAQCKAVHANIHLAGIGAKDYLEIEKLEQEGIKVAFQEFEHPTYPQLHGEFVPNLSVVDYLFCTGGELWCSKQKGTFSEQSVVLSPLKYANR
jgi:hypothetical protein